ncbi:MAG: hypothetical protein N2316_13570, partial [Spirochaetes bacterium]|nr:hypothetical protein [Spirochaetota bacterium]
MEDITLQDVNDFKYITANFVKTKINQFIDEHHPDGNFSLIEDFFREASEIGILPFSSPDSTGYEYGIWGSKTFSSSLGIKNSLTMLSELATACATFAMMVHIQSLAAHILVRHNIQNASLYPFFSLYNGFWPPCYNEMQNPAIHETSYVNGDRFHATLKLGFAIMPRYAIIIFPFDNRWNLFYFESVEGVLFHQLRT